MKQLTPTFDYILRKYGMQRPSFFSGVANFFNISGSNPIDIETYRKYTIEDDMGHDFKMVGADMYKAFEKVKNKVNEELEKQLEIEFK